MKKYRIDRSKMLGNVIFVVEGGRPETGGTELRLLKKIFADILGYEVHELRRGCDEFIAHGKNPLYRVFALNLPKNQLTQLTDESIDNLFVRLIEEFGLKPEECPVYFLYDRDVLSYKKNELRRYVMKYTDPYGTDKGDQGQLLLSYPSIESYLFSCISDNTCAISCLLGRDAKGILSDCIFSDEVMDITESHEKTVDLVFSNDANEAEKRLIHSVAEMDNGLESIGIESYDIDNLSQVLLDVYDYQQKKLNNENVFSFISLVGMALLELGIIVEFEE